MSAMLKMSNIVQEASILIPISEQLYDTNKDIRKFLVICGLDKYY